MTSEVTSLIERVKVTITKTKNLSAEAQHLLGLGPHEMGEIAAARG